MSVLPCRSEPLTPAGPSRQQELHTLGPSSIVSTLARSGRRFFVNEPLTQGSKRHLSLLSLVADAIFLLAWAFNLTPSREKGPPNIYKDCLRTTVRTALQSVLIDHLHLLLLYALYTRVRDSAFVLSARFGSCSIFPHSFKLATTSHSFETLPTPDLIHRPCHLFYPWPFWLPQPLQQLPSGAFPAKALLLSNVPTLS